MPRASRSTTRRPLCRTRPGTASSHRRTSLVLWAATRAAAGRGGGSGDCSSCSYGRRWLTSATTAERSATMLCAITPAACQAR